MKYHSKHDLYWQQGRLFKTKNTKRWSQIDFESADRQEQCMVFKNFSFVDQGRSREFVKRYPNPKEAIKAIIKHNNRIDHLCELFTKLKEKNEQN